MARGWESKSVEDQQEAARASRPSSAPPLAPGEVAAAQAQAGLRLARARILSDLQHACRPAHRAMLEAALETLDARLAAAESEQR